LEKNLPVRDEHWNLPHTSRRNAKNTSPQAHTQTWGQRFGDFQSFQYLSK
jgi:hypothetical protein